MKLTSVIVEPEQLLLDPNNYRFHNLESYRRVNHNKYADNNVQAKTLRLLQSTPEFDLQALKDSIATNGFVPLERIVVEEYDTKDDKKRYLVIEGNRRVASIKTLLEEVQGGSAPISDDKLDTLKIIEVVEIEGSQDERATFRHTLMAIRHVSGVRQWGSYQQAKLIAELYEKVYGEFGKVAKSIGLKARDVGRRYRAIKALEQMENDDEYGESASPKLYAVFDEALASQLVKDWLGWSDKTYRAENDENRHIFYELVIPPSVNGETSDPKLKEIRDVRKLRDIVDKPRAMSILLDSEKTLEDAVNMAKIEGTDYSGILGSSIGQAIACLNQPGVDAWSNLTEEEKQLWNKLVKLVDKIKTIIQ